MGDFAGALASEAYPIAARVRPVPRANGTTSLAWPLWRGEKVEALEASLSEGVQRHRDARANAQGTKRFQGTASSKADLLL
jgi:hypothetical protein